MKKCNHCGKDFEPKNPKGKYCSDKCRVYASRKAISQTIPNGKTKVVDLTKKTEMEIKPKTNPIPRTLDELKALCPPELTGFDRSMWIANERQKYGI